MAKLNYKTATPLSSTLAEIEEKLEKGYTVTSEVSEKKDDIDLSFTSTESFFEKTEPEPESEPEPFTFEAEAPKTEEKLSKFKPERKYHYEDDGFSFDSFSSKLADFKNYFLIGAASIALLIIIYFLYQLIKGDGEVADIQEPPATSIVTEPPKEPITQTKNLALTPIYQENLSGNNVLRTNLQNLFSKKPDTGDYALIVLTPTDLSVTILTNSRNQINNFIGTMRSTLPNFAFTTVSTQSKFSGSQEMFYADIVGERKSTPTFSQNVSQARSLNQKEFIDSFQNLVMKHKIKLDKFNEGKTTNKSTYQEKLYYANLTGKKDDINNMMAELVKTFPMIQITKLALYPHDLDVISNRDILTRLNFTFYSDK
jgi:hypothetical protein